MSSPLQNNITNLRELLEKVNSLPEAEEGNVLPELSNPADTSKVLSGYEFIDEQGEKVTGTIPSKAQTTYTPSTYNQTISAGTYLAGTQTILGDADLVAGNIKKGVNIFGVNGSYDAAELNFKVVGGTTQPTNPSENTIWVNTSVGITSWLFSSTKPTAASNGMVWFAIGTSSYTEFNALKNNGILIYPLVAKQYKNGSWIEVKDMIYQNGKWSEMISDFYLYNKGVFSELTGTIISVAKKVGSNNGGAHTLTINASNVTVGTQGGAGAWVYFPNKIDLTNYKTLCFNGAFNLTHEYGGGGRFGFGVWAETPTSDAVAQAVAFYGLVAPPLASGVYTLDIESLKGEYYVGMALYGYGGSTNPYTQAVLNQMWVE